MPKQETINVKSPVVIRPIPGPAETQPRFATSSGLDNSVVLINLSELKDATINGEAFVACLQRHRAPASTFRVSDAELRNFHANVRRAYIALERSDPRDGLRKALLESTELSDLTSNSALLLFALGHYDLAKGDNGKAKDAYFWARDKGVQGYLSDHRIKASDTAKVIEELRGVDATYRTWCSEKRGAPKYGSMPRSSLVKAAREACPNLEEGDLVNIQARVGKSGKLEFIRAQKCLPDDDGGALSSPTDASAISIPAGIASTGPAIALISPSAGIV